MATDAPAGHECLFCAIVAGRAPASRVYADADTLAFMNQRQANPGHVLVVPRRHVGTLLDLDDALAEALMRTTTRVARAIQAAMGAPGLSLWQSNGAAAGQEIFHLHVHLLPRWPGDGLVGIYPTLPPIEPRARLDELAARLRAAVAASVHGEPTTSG